MIDVRRSCRDGLTLLEVLLAVTLLAIVMTGVTMAFRTSLKTYEMGIRRGEGMQSARSAVMMFSDDLRNIYYMPENRYNVTNRQREAILQDRQQQAARQGRKYLIDEDPNAPELGTPIDLSFRGEDGGPADTVSFVRNQGDKTSDDRLAMGMARVTWRLAGTTLFREVDDVKAPPKDEEGNEIPKENPPRVDKLCENVKRFDVQYGYWYDGEWTLSPAWNSKENEHRNPPDEEMERANYEDRQKIQQGMNNSGLQANGQNGQFFQADDLPAWVDVTFQFEDPKDNSKIVTYRNVVQIPMAQETYFDQTLLRGADPNANSRRAAP